MFCSFLDRSVPLLDLKDVERICAQVREVNGHTWPIVLSGEEKEIVRRIQEKVKEENQDNISRTSAYLSFFCDHTEIHWAFLAHMVSRNGGYNMTDLQGFPMNDIIKDKERQSFFLFLEKANAYIFQDAYPQLLLYSESKKRKKSLFHLLPLFHVSSFMSVIWENFWKKRESDVLTISLIINEQNMIQNRIIDHIEDHLVEKWLFLLQDRLEFTSVLFPFGKHTPLQLAGLSISHFEDPNQRIIIGKKLYSILFHKKIFPTSFLFAKSVTHSASRSDYWNHIYTFDSNNDRNRIFSPALRSVWKPVHHSFKEKEDWFHTIACQKLYPLQTTIHPYRKKITRKIKTGSYLLLKNLTS